MIFTFRSREVNQAQLTKTGAAMPLYTVDFADGMGSATLSSTSMGAANSSNADVRTACVGTVTISGTTVNVQLLTCGTNGSSPASDNSRFNVTLTATLSNGGILQFNTFVFISAPTYAPAS